MSSHSLRSANRHGLRRLCVMIGLGIASLVAWPLGLSPLGLSPLGSSSAIHVAAEETRGANGATGAGAATTETETKSVDMAAASRVYVRDVKPVLKERCYACHGPLKQEAGLRLDSVAGLKQGGDSGPAIDSANPLASRLLARVTATDLATRMPPEGQPLAPAAIAQLRTWIAAGGPAPAKDQPEPDPRDHWAFRPPVRPPVPPIQSQATAATHPIDAFLERALSQRHLAPRPPADRATLLRRVNHDLIGQPTTRDE